MFVSIHFLMSSLKAFSSVFSLMCLVGVWFHTTGPLYEKLAHPLEGFSGIMRSPLDSLLNDFPLVLRIFLFSCCEEFFQTTLRFFYKNIEKIWASAPYVLKNIFLCSEIQEFEPNVLINALFF